MRAVPDQTCRQPVLGGQVAAHVDQVQPAAGTQHAENLGRGCRFRAAVKVVEHHRRQHAVEFAVFVGQSLRVALFEANSVQPFDFSLSTFQRQRIGVGPDYLGARLGAFGANGEIAGTAADFQNALALGEFGLIDQALMYPLEAEQAGQQVVARQECVVASGGKIVMRMIFRHRNHRSRRLAIQEVARRVGISDAGYSAGCSPGPTACRRASGAVITAHGSNLHGALGARPGTTVIARIGAPYHPALPPRATRSPTAPLRCPPSLSRAAV